MERKVTHKKRRLRGDNMMLVQKIIMVSSLDLMLTVKCSLDVDGLMLACGSFNGCGRRMGH